VGSVFTCDFESGFCAKNVVSCVVDRGAKMVVVKVCNNLKLPS
jgi:hypothetical protein